MDCWCTQFRLLWPFFLQISKTITKEQEHEDKITAEIYNDLREIVCNELIINGFDRNENINDYGVILEKLIDDIGDIFM
jgi:hypothetical protein